MNIDTRPPAPAPFEGIDLPSFTLTSSTLTDGTPMPEAATARGGSLSPDLAWEGFPEGTASFMLTCFDPDAPIGLVALGDPGYPRIDDAPGRGCRHLRPNPRRSRIPPAR